MDCESLIRLDDENEVTVLVGSNAANALAYNVRDIVATLVHIEENINPQQTLDHRNGMAVGLSDPASRVGI